MAGADDLREGITRVGRLGRLGKGGGETGSGVSGTWSYHRDSRQRKMVDLCTLFAYIGIRSAQCPRRPCRADWAARWLSSNIGRNG